MFMKNLIVEDVVFNDVDVIALECYIDSFIQTLDFKVVKKSDKIFLIKGGTSIEVTSESILSQIKDKMVGKKYLEIERNSKIVTILGDLNLIKSIIFKEGEEEKVINIF